MKLAILTTHPIQYYAPVFKILHERGHIQIMVFYTWGEKVRQKYDPGFDAVISWDIPVLEGYPYTWVRNTSPDPGTHHYRGIINPDLTRQVQDWQADALLVFGWAWQGHLKALRFFKGRIPIYFRGDSTLLDESGGTKSIIKSIFLRWVYRHVDHAFYTGSNNQAYYQKYGLRDWQLSFAPHAVDNDRFGADRHLEANALRQQLSLSEGDILILFAGKLEQKKSPELLLDVFLTLKRPGVHLLFTGNGVMETQLKAAAPAGSGIHFMDFCNQSRMPVLYQACDLFCLPSKGPGESWGLAVNEAMACGKAVLVSDKVGCAADLIENDYNGRIFNSGNKEALLGCLAALTTSRAGLKAMGELSQRLIAGWSFEQMAEAIEKKVNEKNRQD